MRPFYTATATLPSAAALWGALALAPALESAMASAAELLPPKQAALCSHLQHQMQSLDEALGAYEERAADARRLIETKSELLHGMKEALDQSDPMSVNAYNAKVDQYARTIKRYNSELLPELERRRSAFNAKARQYNKDCAGREVR
jgi:ABC-type transporter Mla subunit MlaD